MEHLVEANSLNNSLGDRQSTDIVTDDPFPIIPIDGTPKNDILRGSPGNDFINGLAGNDLIWGLGGNDLLNGGLGEDLVIGGEGDDAINGGLDSDTLTGSEGNDIFRGSIEEFDKDTITDFSLGDLLIFQGVEFSKNDIAITSSSLDFIQDNVRSGSNSRRLRPFITLGIKVPKENKTIELVFWGKIAEDFLNSGGKESPNFTVTTIQAEPGFFVPPQTIISLEEKPIPTQPKIINGTPNDDRLVGDNSPNLIRGFRGDDTLIGKAREDTLIGGKGDDTLKGGSGKDVLRGNRGDDYLFGDAGRDTLSGGRGDDYLCGFRGNDLLIGFHGQDLLLGGEGNDKLRGNSGKDTLKGGAGDDTLIGGSKNDILYGGEGRDVFVLQSNRGKDIIKDFELGVDILRPPDGLTLDSLIFESDSVGTGTLILNSERNPIAVVKNILPDEIDPNAPKIAYEGFPYLSNFVELHNGLDMHYLDVGNSEADPIVLLHGQPTSSFLWRNIIPELAERGRVIVPDLINFGLSDKTEEPLDFIEDHGALFTEFINTLGLEDITFIGHDWGGPIQLTYAVDHPENIKALAFMESFVVPFPDASVISAFPPPFVEAFWSDPVLSETNIIEHNLLIEGWLFDPAFGGIANPLTEQEQEIYRQPFLERAAREQLAISPRQLPFLDPTGYPILDPDGPQGNPPEAVPSIDKFVEFANYLATTDADKLVIAGNPGFTSPELVQSLATAIPDLEVRTVGSETDPAFHFLQEDVPEELSTVLGEWIDSINETPDPEPPSEVTKLKITIENLAPENGIGFAAVWFGLHDGSFDVFNQGEATSEALEILAEDGLIGLEELILPGILEETVAAGLDINQLPQSVQDAIALGLDLSTLPPPPGTLAGEFLLSDAGNNGGTQGMVVTSIRTNPALFDLLDDPSAFPQEVLDSITNPFFFIQASGETESFTVNLNGTPEENRYFSYASMLFPTNDGFIGNDNPQAIEIFNESGDFIGADFIVTGEETWDAGTEENDESPESLLYTWEAFGNGVDENGTIQEHPGFLAPTTGGALDFEFNGNLVAANADFTVPNYPIARITVTAVEEPDTPGDPIVGTINDDNLVVNGSGQLVLAGAGNDTINAVNSNGGNNIFGGTGDDSLILGTGDMLDGGEGKDRFFAQTGGNNQIRGGVDADQFWIAGAELPNAPQIIEDLELNIDEIFIVGIGATSTADLNFTQNGDDATISFSTTDLAVFLNTDINQLKNNGNFIIQP